MLDFNAEFLYFMSPCKIMPRVLLHFVHREYIARRPPQFYSSSRILSILLCLNQSTNWAVFNGLVVLRILRSSRWSWSVQEADWLDRVKVRASSAYARASNLPSLFFSLFFHHWHRQLQLCFTSIHRIIAVNQRNKTFKLIWTERIAS